MTRITNPVAAALLVACSSGGVAAQNQVENLTQGLGDPVANSCDSNGICMEIASSPNQVDDAPKKQPHDGLRGELDSALAALKTAKSEEREALRKVS